MPKFFIMLKYTLGHSIFLLLLANSYAQALIGIVVYKQTVVSDTMVGIEIVNKATLYFDARENKSVYVTRRLNAGEEKKKGEIVRKDDGLIFIKPADNGVDALGKIIYKSQKTKEIVFREHVGSKVVIITDTYPEINWEIFNETKKIGDLDCQKAQGDFRGRHYTAWFSNKFPTTDGPFKLCGLPGLILEAYDEKKHFIFSVVSVEFPKKIEEPLISPTQGEDIDFKLFYKQKLKATEDARKKLQSINEAHNIKSFEERFSFNFLERNIKD